MPALGLHGSPLIFLASYVKATDYALVYLVRAGLRDAEIKVTFTRMIHLKIKATETKMEFPFLLDTLIEILDIYNPGKGIFNVISYSVDPRWKENVEGYGCTGFELRALKIWYFADASKRLVVSGESRQSVALTMVIHRTTGWKEVTNPLSCAGFSSSNTNVCQEMKKLADDARNASLAPATIPKGQPTHITIDNLEGL